MDMDIVMACCIEDDSLEYYLKQGYSKEEAKRKAEEDAWVSGLVFGGK